MDENHPPVSFRAESRNLLRGCSSLRMMKMEQAPGNPEKEIPPLLRFALSVGMTWGARLRSLGRVEPGGAGFCSPGPAPLCHSERRPAGPKSRDLTRYCHLLMIRSSAGIHCGSEKSARTQSGLFFRIPLMSSHVHPPVFSHRRTSSAFLR